MPNSKTSESECHLFIQTFRLRGMPKAKTEGSAYPGSPKTPGSIADLQKQGLDCEQKGWHVH